MKHEQYFKRMIALGIQWMLLFNKMYKLKKIKIFKGGRDHKGTGGKFWG